MNYIHAIIECRINVLKGFFIRFGMTVGCDGGEKREAKRVYDTPYATISQVCCQEDMFTVHFANDDVVKLPLSTFVPPNARNIRWQDARIELEGAYISIPADPEAFDIP